MSTPTPPGPPADSPRDAGFTLLELTLVMALMGLIMLTAFASFANFQQYALRTACVSQQRAIVSPALLYGFENGISNQDLTSAVLVTADLIAPELGECPLSDTFDSDDYTLVYLNGELNDIDCDVVGLEHPYDR